MEGFCRGCLNKYDQPTDLFQYSESNRRLFVYCTGLQVKRNDTFTFQLCEDCYINMKFACKFKKQCRNSDKKLKNYLALKKNGENIDLCSYLKNAQDTFNLRLPIESRSSSPIHLRTEDDDNVSTCTSIQNFMTDMLQGEEMPPTEAQIIREVIQEEADILDDSLDSHWLQDDVSIDNDFETNFNFNAFSTPRSINNDHCYTPRRLTDNGELNYFTSENNMGSPFRIKTQVDRNNDMPTLDDDGIGDFTKQNIAVSVLETEYDVENIESTNHESINTAHESDMPLIDDGNIEFDGALDKNIEMDELETRYHVHKVKEVDKQLLSGKEKSQDSDVFLLSKVSELTAENDPFVKLDNLKDSLFSVSNDFSPFANSEVSMTNKDSTQDFVAKAANENKFSIILNKGSTTKKESDFPITGELEFCLKNELKKTNDNEINSNELIESEVVNTKNSNMYVMNKSQIEKSIKQSPLTNEIEKYIIYAKLEKATESESNSCNSVMSILKGDKNLTNNIPDTEININPKLGGKCIENIESSLKIELEHYMKNIEFKKKINTVSEENITIDNYSKRNKCPIDRNLELALRNDNSQEYSLDQLLVSPQVSVRSGASTPTINNILFGNITPIHSNTNLVPRLENKLDPIDLIGANHIESGTSKKEYQEEERKEMQEFNDKIKIDEIDNLTEQTTGKCMKLVKMDSEENLILKKQHSKQTRGLKDINKLKDLFKLENSDQSDEVSENDQINSINDESNHSKRDVDDQTVSKLKETDDLDISISSLLNFDENQSIDLNVSISSEFLKEEPFDDDNSQQKLIDDPFKRPFSPPDSTYDMEKCLCKICDKKFGSSKALKIHFMKIHKLKLARKKYVNNVPKVCQQCGEQFTDKSNFNKHLKKHEEPSDFQCDYCTLHFATKGRLSQHMRAHASEINRNGYKEKDNKSKKKFVCSTCGKVSTTMANFKVHQRRHTKSYSVRCKVCQAGFYRTQDLNIHMAKHDGTKTFACELCPKVYSRRDLLMGHMYRHLNKKRFACEICDLHFISKHSLNTHFTSKMCLKKRDDLAKAARESTTGNAVKVIHSVGSTEKIKKIMETKNAENGNSEFLEISNQVTEEEKEAGKKSNDNSVIDKIIIAETENPD